MPEEATTNPAAPDDHHVAPDRRREPLSNKDFRKLLETPRHPGAAAEPPSSRGSAPAFARHGGGGRAGGAEERRGAAGKTPAHHAKRKTPGGSHHKSKKEEEDELTAIMKKYRDRAKERRVGEGKDTEEEMMRVAAGGVSVSAQPSVGEGGRFMDPAEKRRQAIQDSKYLGGDMEHTHLVKGLDYALLQKVRSEMVAVGEGEEEELESAFAAKEADPAADDDKAAAPEITHPMARNVYRILFKDEPPRTNELFGPRRMAYVIELDEENPDASDIPTTLIRSKTYKIVFWLYNSKETGAKEKIEADCPVEDTATADAAVDEMVITKLSQVLSYLRADTKRKKKTVDAAGDGKAKAAPAPAPQPSTLTDPSQSIYGDIGDYVPEKPQKRREERRDRDRRDRGKGAERSYFDKPATESKRKAEPQPPAQAPAPAKPKKESKAEKADAAAKKDRDIFAAQKPGGTAFGASAVDDDSYAECYPGGMATYDAAGESDDEADYSKMDMGARKGPVKRWDFESQEDYEKYQNSKEALPKAAYQFGVKMSDGRKSRRSEGAAPKDAQKHKLDKQWTQISRILAKRDEEG